MRDSKGHFFKSVLLWVSGQRPGGNAAGQHGFVEAIMFSERGFGGGAPDIMRFPKKTRKRFLFLLGRVTHPPIYMAGRIHLIREPPNLILFGSGNPYTPKCSPRRPTSLAAAFIYYFAEPIRKVFAESGGHFFKSVLLCGFGSEAPGGNAARQHGFAEAAKFRLIFVGATFGRPKNHK